MQEFINSNQGLIVAVLAIITGIVTLIIKLVELITKLFPGATRGIPERLQKILKKSAPNAFFLVPVLLIAVGLIMLAGRGARPTVAIRSPSGTVEVTAVDHSVWFSVSGTSSRVFPNHASMIYVLVWSDPEWHVQRPATTGPDGRWTLDHAWIGDPSARIRVGDQMKLIAVVSQGKYQQDEKFSDYRQLDPIAFSEIVLARVAAIREK
jgi:hypothetical protein